LTELSSMDHTQCINKKRRMPVMSA